MDSLGPVSRKQKQGKRKVQGVPQSQATAQSGLMRMTKKSRNSLKRNTKITRHTSVIPAQYLVRLPIQTSVRQFRLGSETCKTPG